MKTYTLYQIDSFTTEKFTGNPAAVVTNADELSDDQMQKVARELNNSETAFIFKADSENRNFKSNPHDVHVRFFTPTMEVPMCGHATIAAHYARAHELNLTTSQVIQKVGAGILPVDIIRLDSEDEIGKSEYKIVMTQGDITFDNPLDFDIVGVICEALGITTADLVDHAPIQIVSTGHSKVMVCIKSYQQLKQLNPDFEELIEISESIGCNGFLVFTKDMPEIDDNEDADYVSANEHIDNYFINARMFGPALGINEDPVNGSSGGALGAYLINHNLIDSKGKSQVRFKVRQGFSVDRIGGVEVSIDLDEEGNPVLGKITGDAVIIFKTDLVI